jgi:outer membrane receptor for ferrienterochelin and colicins
MRRFPLLLVSVLLVALPVRAEEEADEVVVITAERAEEGHDDTAASVSVVDEGEIEQRSPADVGELLDEVPGVDVQTMSPSGYGTNVSIRGSSDFKPGGFGNRVLVLLDGRPVNSPDTHAVDWAALPVFDTRKLEVLRGPASALYGSVAVGGVVQLFSRPPQRGAEVLLGQGFAGVDGNRSKLAGSVSDVGSGWGWRLSGWLQQYGGLKPSGEDGFRHNSDSDRYGLRLTGLGNLAEHHRLDGEVSWMHSAGGNPGFEGTSGESRSRRFDRGTLGSRLTYRHGPVQGLSLEGSAFWNRFRGRVSDPGGGNENIYDTDRIGLRALSTFLLWARLLNTVGGEMEYQHVLGDVFQLGADQTRERTVSVLMGAVFLQSRLDLGAGFELTGGLRLDGYSFDTGQSYISLSPKFRCAWRPDDDTVIWAAVNRGFRAPSVGELYLRYESSFGLVFQGNPELDPEVLWAFELGARRTMLDGKLRLEAVGFWNEGDGTIEFDYRVLPVVAKNLAGSRIIGAELSVAGDVTRWLLLKGTFAYMNAKNLTDDTRLLYRPEFKGSVSAILHGEYLELGVHASGVSDRAYDDFLAATGMDIPRRTLNPYLLVDIDLVWRTPWSFVIAAHLRNLFDNPFYIIQNYPPPGREWYLEVRLPLL